MSPSSIDLTDGRLKLRHLRIVMLVAECGTIGAAADELEVSQPVVTRAIQEVEAIVGMRIFERSRTGVVPTGVGERFLLHARSVMTQLSFAARDLNDSAIGRTGVVRVATNTAGSDPVLLNGIRTHQAENPNAVVVIREMLPRDMVPALMAGDVDILIGHCVPLDDLSDLQVVSLYREPLLPVVHESNDLVDRPNLDLGELIDYHWVLPGERTQIRNDFNTLCLDAGLSVPEHHTECLFVLTAAELVKHSVGSITPLPPVIVNANPTLRALEVSLGGLGLTHSIITRKFTQPSHAATVFLEHLVAVEREELLTA